MAKILLVEPDEGLRVRMGAALEAAGHEVRFASSGPAAWEAYGRAYYELVIVALVLPGLNGLVLTRRMMTRDGWVRVIATATAGDPLLLRAQDEGCVGALAGPVSTEALIAAVEQALATPRPWERTGRVA